MFLLNLINLFIIFYLFILHKMSTILMKFVIEHLAVDFIIYFQL